MKKKHPTALYHLDHPRPKTRREFLSQGFIQSMEMLVLPSLLNFLSAPRAIAEECPGAQVTQMAEACFVIDCAGGMGTTNLTPPLNQNREPLPAYNRITSRNDFQTTDRFGIRVNTTDEFYNHLTVNTGQNFFVPNSVLQNTSIVGFCGQTTDDTNNNPLGVQSVIAQVGGIGSLLPILGTTATSSGGRSRNTLPLGAAPTPALVRTVNDANTLLTLSPTLDGLSNSPEQDRRELLSAVQKMSASQIQRAASMQFMDGLKSLVNCGFQQAQNLLQTTIELDGRAHPAIANAFGATEASAPNTLEARRSTIVRAVMEGHSPCGVFMLGGADYHTGNMAARLLFHERLATLLGPILNAAAVLNKRTFIFVITDGSIFYREPESGSAAGAEDRVPRSDRGIASMQLLITYNPAGQDNVIKSGQVGYFTDGQAAARDTVIGNNPTALALSMVLNFCYLTGRIPQFQQVVSADKFPRDAATIDQHLGFG